jgi:membrane protease YdiL (CAAX protease family)
MKKHPFAWFLVLTFGITWGLAALFFSFSETFERLFGEMSATNPVFVLAVWGPNIAGAIVVGVKDGKAGLVSLLKRFLPVRAGVLWYLLAALMFPVAGILINLISGDQVTILEEPLKNTLPMMLAILISGPLGEELGWRGFALPHLLKKQSALTAALLLGVIWGIWHLPSFFTAGLPQMGLQIPAFLLAACSISVVVTWIFVNTKQNIFIAFLLHYTVNFTYTLLGTDFLKMAVFQVVLAAIIAFVFGKNLQVKKADKS